MRSLKSIVIVIVLCVFMPSFANVKELSEDSVEITTIVDVYAQIIFEAPCGEVKYDSIKYISNRDILRVDICSVPFVEITRSGDVYLNGKITGKLIIDGSEFRIIVNDIGGKE